MREGVQSKSLAIETSAGPDSLFENVSGVSERNGVTVLTGPGWV